MTRSISGLPSMMPAGPGCVSTSIFALGQARLGPGRIHHCMRLIGMAERAYDLMCTRALKRVAFGKPLADNGDVQRIIADSRVQLDQLRLLVLRTAWLIDTVGAKQAATEISEIKICVPSVAQEIIDRSIQIHGAAGLTSDFPLLMGPRRYTEPCSRNAS